MKILSLNPHMPQIDANNHQLTYVGTIYSTWDEKQLFAKVIALCKAARKYDAVSFYQDYKLALLFGLISGILRFKVFSILQEYYFDPNSYLTGKVAVARSSASLIRLLGHLILARSMTLILVHSSKEVEIYSNFLHVNSDKFRFVPYFVYDDASEHETLERESAIASRHVLAAGRHRDFNTFIEALRGTEWSGVIVAGMSDACEIGDDVPSNVQVYYEVPRHVYRDFVADASIIVIPLHPSKWQRSLGQIALFEAGMMRKPIVAANTFQLTDYVDGRHVLWYEPGNSADLREQIHRVMADPDLCQRLGESAFQRVSRFSQRRYIEEFLAASQQVLNDTKLRR
jgi:glycosyltransferase involved in cell wall biosynthesis